MESGPGIVRAMMRQKRLLLVALSFVVVAVVIAGTRRHVAPFSVRVAYYDAVARSAAIDIRNDSESGLRYGFWQKGSITARVYSRLEPHETGQLEFLVDKDCAPEIFIEGTQTTFRAVFGQRIPYLDRIWIRTVSSSAMSLSLTNGSRWVRY